MRKKLLSVMLSIGVLAGTLSGTVLQAAAKSEGAADLPVAREVNVSSKKEGENGQVTPETLEQALISVRSKIEVPEEFLQGEFEYDYHTKSTYSDAGWIFFWRNDDGYLMIACDSEFHIMEYHIRPGKEEAVHPEYLKNELAPVAENFVKKVLPEAYGSLTLSDSGFTGFSDNCYYFTYERVEQGIPMPDNTVTVMLNTVTGEVRELSSSYVYGLSIPKPSVKVTKEEAKKLLKQSTKMQLEYRNYYELDAVSGKYKLTAKLVYVPQDSYRSVDAVTGEIYTEREQWVTGGNNNNSSKEDADSEKREEAGVSGSKVTLSEAEQKRIEELGEYLTEEEAIAKVRENDALYLEQTLYETKANLRKDTDLWGKDCYRWKVELFDPRPVINEEDEYRAYATAVIDAKDGTLLSFSSNIRDYYNSTEPNVSEKKYSLKQCKATAEQILKTNLNLLYKNTRLFYEEDGGYILARAEKKLTYGGYEFSYIRVNEGVDYPYHQINVTVDAVSGKLLSLRYSWDNTVAFESPVSILSSEEAFQAYLNTEQFRLIYELNYRHEQKENASYAEGNYQTTPEVRLVYRNDLNPAVISPFTGMQVSWNGTELKQNKQYTYQDIDELDKKRDILLLADLGLGFEGEKFLPEQPVTVSEWRTLTQAVLSGRALKELPDMATMTREQIAKLLMEELGLLEVASLKGIYQTGFSDEALISPEALGAVALAKGFGFLTEKQANQFMPDAKITRLEAVEIFFKLLSFQKQ